MAAVFEVKYNYVRAHDDSDEAFTVVDSLPTDSKTVSARHGQEAIDLVATHVVMSALGTRGRKSERVVGISIVSVKLISILDL